MSGEHVIYDEIPDLSLAAKDGTAADPQLARLDLIDRAKANGATWALIGTALGMTGREAKRHAHKLRRETQKTRLRTQAPRLASRKPPPAAATANAPGQAPECHAPHRHNAPASTQDQPA